VVKEAKATLAQKTSPPRQSLPPAWQIVVTLAVIAIAVFLAIDVNKASLEPTSQPTGLAPQAASTARPTVAPTSESANIAQQDSLTLEVTLTAMPGLPAGTQRTDATGIAQVWVPPGCFSMGSDPSIDKVAWSNELPAHPVCLTNGYWIDQYDVTNAAFDTFVKAGGYSNDAYWSPDPDSLKWKQANNIIGPAMDCTKDSNDPQQPRICVSWYEAEAYARWRTKTAHSGAEYVLPSEAEWEYAARGPQGLIYPWGNNFDGTRVNYCDKNCSQTKADKSTDDGYAYTSPVGHYEQGKSWVNAYDMVGNAWQWVADWYSDSYYQNSPLSNPTGPNGGTYRVIRGGAWFNVYFAVRTAFRTTCYPYSRCGDITFRLVVPPDTP
jgi:formylglycine-generating enzyme required for sulfatase activity